MELENYDLFISNNPLRNEMNFSTFNFELYYVSLGLDFMLEDAWKLFERHRMRVTISFIKLQVLSPIYLLNKGWIGAKN